MGTKNANERAYLNSAGTFGGTTFVVPPMTIVAKDDSHQDVRREADEDIRRGRVKTFKSAGHLVQSLRDIARGIIFRNCGEHAAVLRSP